MEHYLKVAEEHFEQGTSTEPETRESEAQNPAQYLMALS